MSGSRTDRPEYNNIISQLRKGDTVVIWKIDRLGRTTLELVRLMTELKEKGIRFVSVTEGIDTGTQMGKVWFMLCAVFAPWSYYF